MRLKLGDILRFDDTGEHFVVAGKKRTRLGSFWVVAEAEIIDGEATPTKEIAEIENKNLKKADLQYSIVGKDFKILETKS